MGRMLSHTKSWEMCPISSLYPLADSSNRQRPAVSSRSIINSKMARSNGDGESSYRFFHPSFEVSECSGERAEHEERHRWAMDHSFYKSLIITPGLTDTRLPHERLHEACNKSCALYCIPNIPYTGPLTSNSRNNIFNAVYNAWNVPNECSIFYGAFATQLIGCWDGNSPKDIKSILKSHMPLCKQVQSREKDLGDVDKSESALHVNYPEKFTLTSSYRAVVI